MDMSLKRDFARHTLEESPRLRGVGKVSWLLTSLEMDYLDGHVLRLDGAEPIEPSVIISVLVRKWRHH